MPRPPGPETRRGHSLARLDDRCGDASSRRDGVARRTRGGPLTGPLDQSTFRGHIRWTYLMGSGHDGLRLENSSASRPCEDG